MFRTNILMLISIFLLEDDPESDFLNFKGPGISPTCVPTCVPVRICKRLRSPEIDSKESIRQLHRLAESISGLLKVYKFGLVFNQYTWNRWDFKKCDVPECRLWSRHKRQITYLLLNGQLREIDGYGFFTVDIMLLHRIFRDIRWRSLQIIPSRYP